MRRIFYKVAQFVTGDDYAPANPDINHNIEILKQAAGKIETGIYSRIFKRPLVIFLETGIYLLTIVLTVLTFYYWNKIDNLFMSAETIQKFGLILSSQETQANDYSGYSYLILAIMLLPALLCFLLGRLFTKSRKRMAIFIEVENNIKTVIKNLS
ncbi:MAG TPA: hypothetical protein PLR98_05805 [Chitinophagaceae bacterium]|nr:hypothetical protein [Chitinophagaceae bacterium]